MQQWIVGNWKMCGSLVQAQARAAAMASGVGQETASRTWVICPPMPHLETVGRALAGSGVALGAQDVSPFEEGAHTGQVSANMLQELGCAYVLVGHSERRQECSESDDMVAKKAAAAHNAGITPIVCVGETQEEHDAGATLEVLARQIKAVQTATQQMTLLAYEPIWAIGTGRAASVEHATRVHTWLAKQTSWPVLYGGSVKPDNAVTYLGMPHGAGVLVGGASLEAETWLAIGAA